MNDIKEKFFNEGFISKINLFQKNEMNMIFDEYQDFLKKKNKLVDLVEHKSKTHLFFPWANVQLRVF